MVWELTESPSFSNCSLMQSLAVWKEVSILSPTLCREVSSCCKEGPDVDSLQKAVIASTITLCVGLESCAFEMACGEEPEILFACGEKSTCFPRSRIVQKLY